MHIRKLWIFYLLFLAFKSFCQQNEKGVSIINSTIQKQTDPKKTFALIFGISKYQNFQSLQFADKDAIAFKDFLLSKAGGGIDSNNIFIRLNEQAKGGDIWRGITWLEKRADSVGETAYIYFSGHGDAANAEEAYLLANDAPNEGDPNLYNMGGTLQIFNLKTKIKKMVAQGVKVYLITDACRTNELPGKVNGNRWTFANITEQRSGEIQMASCASNEKSLEDTRWGNGRGVFSYYLINGLSGLADNDPEDGEVTLYELEKYVKDNVRKDTRNLTGGKPKQNPFFCCTEFNENTLAKVDAKYKQALLQSIKKPDGNEGKTSVAIKGNFQNFFDSTQTRLYKNFIAAIERRNLIEPKDSSAEAYLYKLLPLIQDETQKSDLKDELVAELVNEAQKVINRYTNPPSDRPGELNYNFFNNGAKLLLVAEKFFESENTWLIEIKAKRFFLEARASLYNYGVWSKNNIKNAAKKAKEKAISSINLRNTTYANHVLGLSYDILEIHDSAIHYFRKAYNDSPDWIYCIQAIINHFQLSSRKDSAARDSVVSYARKAMQLGVNKPNIIFSLANALTLYNDKNKNDSAAYLFKFLIEKKGIQCHEFLGQCYSKKYGNLNLFFNYLKDSDPNSDRFNFILARYYESFNLDSSLIYLSKIKDFKFDELDFLVIPTTSFLNEDIHIDTIFVQNIDGSISQRILNKVFKMRGGIPPYFFQNNGSILKFAAAKVYLENKKNDIASSLFYGYCNDILSDIHLLDSWISPNAFINSYFTLNEIDTIRFKELTQKILKNVKNPFLFSNLADKYYYKGDYTKAITYYEEQIMALDFHNMGDNFKIYKKCDALYNISCCYSLLNNKPESLKYLRLAFEKGYKDFIHIAEDIDLDNVKKDPQFEQLIKKYSSH